VESERLVTIMPNTTDIAIIAGARTPMARYCGKLKDFSAQELAAVAAREAIHRAEVDPAQFDHVVIGNAQQTTNDALYGARHVALKAGLPVEVPALTVNRLCGSGMQAIVSGAQLIQLGEAHTVLAGGMEAMSQAPHTIRGMRWGVGLGEGKLEDSLMAALFDTQCGLAMAQTAELYAEQQGITREKMDEFALASQRKAGDAQKACRLSEEITPVALRNRKGEPTGEWFDKDDHLRPDTTPEVLAKLRPAFGKNGTVTAGNASGIVDGGAAVILMSIDDAAKQGKQPLGRIVSWGIAGGRS
jgi:acetyl-CoA acetyltransferase family protein